MTSALSLCTPVLYPGLVSASQQVPFYSDARQVAQVYCLFVLELNIIAAGKQTVQMPVFGLLISSLY